MLDADLFFAARSSVTEIGQVVFAVNVVKWRVTAEPVSGEIPLRRRIGRAGGYALASPGMVCRVAGLDSDRPEFGNVSDSSDVA